MAAAAQAAARADRRPRPAGGTQRPRSGTATRAGRPTGVTSSPTSRSGSSTTAGRTPSTPSPRSRPRRRASTSSARSRSVAQPTRATRSGARSTPPVSGTCARSTTASCPPSGWRAEIIDAGDLGEIRHFRGRYLQDWADDPASTRGASTRTRRAPALGDLGGARGRPRPLPRGRHRVGLGAREDLPSSPAGRWTTRSRPQSSLRAARSAPSSRRRLALGRPERLPVGDQRLQGPRSRSTWSG